MLNKIILTSAAVAMAAMMASPATAQSSKSAAVNAAGQLISGSRVVVSDYLTSSIKAPNAKELVIDLSVQCGLYTYTLVKGKGGSKDSSTAAARVVMEVDVQGSDDVSLAGFPQRVTYCERQQQLDATLGGYISNLEACTGSGENVDCILEDEEIALALRTLSANAYNFFALNLPGSDIYTVSVTAILDSCDNGIVNSDETSDLFLTCSDDSSLNADAKAFINGASMYVEEVRFMN